MKSMMWRGRAELPGVALRAEDGKQVFERVAKRLRVAVLKAVDLTEEEAERLRVAVWQEGVVEDAAERAAGMRGFSGIRVIASA